MALREKFFALKDTLERVTVDLDGIGKVIVRDLTGRERMEYEKFVSANLDNEGRAKSNTQICAKLVVLGTEDEDKAAIFKPDDVDKVLECIPSSIIQELAGMIAVISGIVKPEKPSSEPGDDDSDEPLTDTHLEGVSPKNDDGEQSDSL